MSWRGKAHIKDMGGKRGTAQKYATTDIFVVRSGSQPGTITFQTHRTILAPLWRTTLGHKRNASRRPPSRSALYTLYVVRGLSKLDTSIHLWEAIAYLWQRRYRTVSEHLALNSNLNSPGCQVTMPSIRKEIVIDLPTITWMVGLLILHDERDNAKYHYHKDCGQCIQERRLCMPELSALKFLLASWTFNSATRVIYKK